MQQCRITLLVCTLFAYAASQENGDVRLVDGPSDIRGKLEVYEQDKGDWSSFCYDYQIHKDQEGVAQLACRQLGFFNFEVIGNVTKFDLNDTAPTMNKLTTVNCPSIPEPDNAAQHVFRCPVEAKQCEDGDEMAIQCSEETRGSFAYDTMVDFYNDEPSMGGSMSDGYALVYINGKFGPVCNMGQDDADTFCRQLSYTNAVTVGNFMNMTMLDPQVLDKFHCTGTNAACLVNCFDYPSADQEINCPDGFSYVTCTFKPDANDELLEFYGTKSSCEPSGSSSSSNTGAIAGGVVGGVLGLAIIILVIGMVCFFVPGCYCHRGKRGSYSPMGNSKTKYDAI